MENIEKNNNSTWSECLRPVQIKKMSDILENGAGCNRLCHFSRVSSCHFTIIVFGSGYHSVKVICKGAETAEKQCGSTTRNEKAHAKFLRQMLTQRPFW